MQKYLPSENFLKFFLRWTYLALICWAAPDGSMPCTTEMFTPAFSNTVPSCMTQEMPPPPYSTQADNNMYPDRISQPQLSYRPVGNIVLHHHVKVVLSRARPPGARRAKMLYYKKHHCSGTPMMPPGSRISELHLMSGWPVYGLPKVPGSILTVITVFCRPETLLVFTMEIILQTNKSPMPDDKVSPLSDH